MSQNWSSAAIDRPLRLRVRPDVQIVEQWFGGRRYFVIKDPLTLNYSYLTEQEHLVLSLLDGHASIADIQQRFEGRFAPQQITASQIQTFVSQLHRSGLVLGDAPGQGHELERRRSDRRQHDLLRWAEKMLAIRWRGMNPQPLLTWLEPKIGWMFSRGGFLLWLAVVCFAAAVVVTRFDDLERQMLNAAAWLNGPNVLLLGLALILVKSLHELGHALAARRFGCQCREMGIQLFFLVPCLYTNVSDVWLIKSKWRRIAVSAAGMYVELFLASVAAILWWQAEPGVFSSLCQSVVLVASIGTLVLNGNPLMRYDGYYILSDLLEIPNLEQRSRSQLVAWLARWCTGVDWEPPEELDHRQRPLLAVYAAGALAYRAAVLVAVYLASRAMLRPFRLEPLSDLLIAGAALGIIIPLATTLGQFLVHARRTNELRWGRLLLSAGAFTALFAAACFVPLPQRVSAPVVIESRDASRIYATVSGILVDTVAAGTSVRQGQPIARLESSVLRRDLVRLEAERRQQELRLNELETLRGEDPARAAAIPTARQSLTDLEVRVVQVRELISRLTLVAPHDGIILPPPNRRQHVSPRELAGWSGTPLEHENIGSAIETGTLVCLVARSSELDAVAIVDQADASLMQSGRKAMVAVPPMTGGAVQGTIEQVAQIDTNQLPLHLVATGALPQQTDSSGAARPLRPNYQVRIQLDGPLANLVAGATGRASIVAPPQPLATRVLRWLSRTFRFGASKE